MNASGGNAGYAAYGLFSVIEEINEENSKLKERFQVYKNRLNEITKKNYLPDLTKKNSALKETLNGAVLRLEALKRDKDTFSIQNLGNSGNLEEQKQALEQKLMRVKAENEYLKEKKRNQCSENTEIEKELLASIAKYKQKILELENQHIKNKQILKSLKDRKNSPDPDHETNEKSLEKLWKIEKNLKSSLKLNDLKYKQKLKELENTAEKLSADKICIQMKILKTTQQERLLQMTIDQNLSNNEHSFNDANFLYKPSIKALYH